MGITWGYTGSIHGLGAGVIKGLRVFSEAWGGS